MEGGGSCTGWDGWRFLGWMGGVGLGFAALGRWMEGGKDTRVRFCLFVRGEGGVFLWIPDCYFSLVTWTELNWLLLNSNQFLYIRDKSLLANFVLLSSPWMDAHFFLFLGVEVEPKRDGGSPSHLLLAKTPWKPAPPTNEVRIRPTVFGLYDKTKLPLPPSSFPLHPLSQWQPLRLPDFYHLRTWRHHLARPGPAGSSHRNRQPLTRLLAAWNQFHIHAGPRICSLPWFDTRPRPRFSVASPLAVQSSPGLFVGARCPRYLRGLGIETRGPYLSWPTKPHQGRARRFPKGPSAISLRF